jgi:allophanate hydrolase subunit 2
LFGSISSDLLSGLGPGALEPGDELDVGNPGRPRGYLPRLDRNKQTTVRLIPGPEEVDPEALLRWVDQPFEVRPDSNRIGVRLGGPRPLKFDRKHKGSYGMVEGAVQLPPSEEPIVLLCDHATTGGYPVIATVISADIGFVAQCRPGDAVQFEIVDLETAERARQTQKRLIDSAPSGYFPDGEVS